MASDADFNADETSEGVRFSMEFRSSADSGARSCPSWDDDDGDDGGGRESSSDGLNSALAHR